MSQENVEIVRAIYNAYGRGDYAAAFDLLGEDVEWSEPPDNPAGAQSWRGHEGVRGALTRWVGAWDDYRIELRELIDCGELVLAVCHQNGRGKGSGVEISEEIFSVWTLRGGKAVRQRMLRDRAQAFEAAGLSE